MTNEEVELYSARPFVGYAGADGNGFRQEVLVRKGVGMVDSINEKGITAQVTVSVPSLKYPLSGWINVDSEPFKLIKQAYSNNTPIEYRIETQRRHKAKESGDEIDPHTPIYELMGADENGHNPDQRKTNTNTRKLFVGAANPGGEMLFSQELTNPAEDHMNDVSGPTSARTNPGGAVGVPVDATVTNSIVEANASTEYENPPFIATNPDGKPNVGSNTVQAPIDLYFWFYEQEQSGKFPELNDKRRKMLVAMMLSTAEGIQQELYGDEVPANRELGSFKTIMKALKDTSLTIVPLTAESIAEKEAVKEWANKLRIEATEVVKWAVQNAERFLVM